MPNYKPGPGRRSKGARKAFMTRLPQDVADAVVAEAAARNVSLSEYLALIAARAHDFEVSIPPRQKPLTEQSALEEISLSKSA